MTVKSYIKRLITFVISGQPQNYTSAKIVHLSVNNLLDGRCALITGGTSGIGFAIAQAFLRSGASVIITSRSEKRLKIAFSKLNIKDLYTNNIFTCVLDNQNISLFSPTLSKLLIDINKKGIKWIDILVNNAGVDSGSMPNITEDEYDKVLDTNLKGVFFLSQLIAKYMVKNRIKGNILNISSSSSLRPGNSPYILSKWGIRSLTMGLAKTLAPHGITVNSIAPGLTLTPMIGMNDMSNIATNAIPMGRYAMPEEIANMAVILVSDMGRTVVGDTLYMTGGLGNLTVDDYERRYKFD